ncbi:MAG: hypothetical protein M1327_06760 [Candidatus Thermoplasmatota archaeon]|nr:hypothetical protein [Candidatus Thermoplasmatota archaeon]
MLFTIYQATSKISINSLLSYIPFKYPAYAVIILILLLFLYRLLRAKLGEKFSHTRVFLSPVIYSLLVLLTFIYQPEVVIISSFIIALLGIVLGVALSRNVEIFQKKNDMYYKRSVPVAFFFTLFFTLKILSLLYYPTLYLVSLFSVLLTVTTGMLIGEAIVIYHRHSKFYNNVKLGA